MGYRGGAPPWVYKNQMASQASSYNSQIGRLNDRIKELENENEALKKRVEELEEQLAKK